MLILVALWREQKQIHTGDLNMSMVGTFKVDLNLREKGSPRKCLKSPSAGDAVFFLFIFVGEKKCVWGAPGNSSLGQKAWASWVKVDGRGSKPLETPGEHQNRWQMDVHPPQNWAIGLCNPWPDGAIFLRMFGPPPRRRSRFTRWRRGEEHPIETTGRVLNRDCWSWIAVQSVSQTKSLDQST